jgi:formate dehydrogenase iron-sulfur subunit
MARMKFICDANRCIECNGCVTACKNANEVPWGVNRRRVVTLNDGVPGERSVSVACMHCSDAPCMAVCPVDCFRSEDGVVLHDMTMHGCGYCCMSPLAPQFRRRVLLVRGKMDKSRSARADPARAVKKFNTTVRPELHCRGQSCRCADVLRKALLAGGEVIEYFRERVTVRGRAPSSVGTAYDR